MTIVFQNINLIVKIYSISDGKKVKVTTLNVSTKRGTIHIEVYCFSTTFGGAVSGAAERKKFRKRKRIILSQAQNGLKFINAIAGAGFDISTDVGKKLSMCLVLELQFTP